MLQKVFLLLNLVLRLLSDMYNYLSSLWVASETNFKWVRELKL